MNIGFEVLPWKALVHQSIARLHQLQAEAAEPFSFKVLELKNALVDEWGTVHCQGKVLQESLRLSPVQQQVVEQAGKQLEVQPYDALASGVIGACGGLNNYFHFLIDILQPRLVASLHGFSAMPMLMRNYHQPFQQELLSALPDIQPRPLHRTGYVQVATLYYVLPLHSTKAYSRAGLYLLRDRLQHGVGPGEEHQTSSQPAYFLSRSASSNRQVLNVQELERLAEQSGYQVLLPEQWSVRDQIRQFRSAASICGFSGAALTNLLFCQPGSKVLEILPERALERQQGGFWRAFAQALQLNHQQLVMPQEQVGVTKDRSTYRLDAQTFQAFLQQG